jgi:3-hydroxy-9,10-secoandrosta-1,3,5(10)-triene-9,17-dione monooxygenase reductase component
VPETPSSAEHVLVPDDKQFRSVLGHFATGVTIITAMDGDEPVGMAANSFTSLSLDPPLVLFCIGRGTKTGQLIHVGTRFCVSILHEGQRDLSTYFGGGWKSDVPPPFAFVNWHDSPRLDGSAAALSCRVEAIHEGGDHWIVVGHVAAFQRREDGVAPLVFHAGRYVGLAEEKTPT